MDVPAHLKAIVDTAAGREHSVSGAVMRCLAEVLAVHEKDVLRAVAARQRHYRDHVDPECGMDALITLIDPDRQGDIMPGTEQLTDSVVTFTVDAGPAVRGLQDVQASLMFSSHPDLRVEGEA